MSYGRTLLAEIRKLGYVGCYSGLAIFLSPWRQPKAETRRAISAFPDASQLEPTISTGSRQLSPQAAAALLSKVLAELTFLSDHPLGCEISEAGDLNRSRRYYLIVGLLLRIYGL